MNTSDRTANSYSELPLFCIFAVAVTLALYSVLKIEGFTELSAV